jgi:hypothetical protein
VTGRCAAGAPDWAAGGCACGRRGVAGGADGRRGAPGCGAGGLTACGAGAEDVAETDGAAGVAEAGTVGFDVGAVAAGGATETGGRAAGAGADGADATGAGAEGAGLVRAALAAASFACDSALAADCAVDSSSEPLIFARTFTATSSGMELE